MVREALFHGSLISSSILALGESDPSLQSVDECANGIKDLTRLYREIFKEEGRTMLINFIITLKGIIPDHHYKDHDSHVGNRSHIRNGHNPPFQLFRFS